MALDVFWHLPRGGDVPAALWDMLDDDIVISAGAEPPDEASYGVLIGVSPTSACFQASDDLRTFVIAQAGFTVMAQAEVAAHGNLAVFNLHNNAAACAETAVALVLACAKSTVVADQDLRGGRWTTRYSAAPQLVLSGRTAVVLGRGEIGRRVTPVLEALGMSVAEIGRTNAADLDDALSGAAVLVMALPGTPSTAGIIDDHRLDLLAPGAIVVNVGRAGQIDEQALYHRLADGRLGGAGIDVWSIEPTIEETDKIVIPSTLPFHELDNVVMSPHKAGWLPHGDTSKFEDLAAVLNALNRGVEPPNRVDVDHGY